MIKTEKISLRNIKDSDLDKVFEGLSHPDVIKYYGVSFKTKSETQAQMNWYENLILTETGIWWAIICNETKEFAGAIGLNNRSREHKKAEVGYWLLPKFWKKGLIQEAMPLVVDYGFQKMDLHRIECFVEAENTSSKMTLSKLNFNFEGTMIDCEFKNNQFISLSIYSKIKEGRFKLQMQY